MVATAEHIDVEKSDVIQAENRSIDAPNNVDPFMTEDYAPPDDTTWKTWVVIFVSQ